VSIKGDYVRFFKSFSIIVIALLTILLITYSARISIINNVAKDQLGLYQINLTCLDFSLSGKLNIVVDKLCLQSPKADIEIIDMVVVWQVLPRFKIINIDIKQANVRATEHLLSSVMPNNQGNKRHNNNQNIHQLLSETLLPHLEQIKQFKLPININISELSYLPFAPENKSKYTPYFATLSVKNNNVTFSLKNADKVKFIKGDLSKVTNKSNVELSLTLSSKLHLLKSFINTHRLPITTKFQQLFAANKISGHLDTVIKYQADSINMHNQIPNLIIVSEHGIDSSGPYKLEAKLNIKSQLDLKANPIAKKAKSEKSNQAGSEIALIFQGKNALSLEYSQPHFFAMLEKQQVSPAIISILKDNPITQLSIIQQNNETLTLSNKQLTLSSIELNANSEKRVNHLKLDDITLNFDDMATNSFSIGNFILDSQVKLSTIAKQTTEPLSLHLEGSLQQTAEQTNLDLYENSLITAKQIVLTQQPPNASKTTKNNALVKLQTLTTALEGNIELKADKIFSSNIRVNNKASLLDIPKAIKVNIFELTSEIKGSFDDIQINATASADEIKIANINITGPVLSPKVELIANQLKLTDLLSLNIQLPIKIELIDGILNYRISGHLTNLNQWDKNLLNGSLSLTSVSGEIEGVWLKELNWQQDFTLSDGKITTLSNDTENLTVALIDTPTPISKLSVQTSWAFNDSFKFSVNKLKADVLGGSFSVPSMEWPFENGHSANVQLDSIDLEQVLALDKKQGIVVTGDISGKLPITFDGDKYIIENGELHNINNGLIQVLNNPAVAELKENNTQLQLAFDALQNLHYHQLSSAVSMADDGYMLLETVIKGRNPDIDNDVNLNLNLNYDLLGLLESMSITQRFEDNIIKGLQKDKE